MQKKLSSAVKEEYGEGAVQKALAIMTGLFLLKADDFIVFINEDQFLQ